MLVLDSVVKYFHRGSVNEVLALSGINLAVEKGDFITIIGSNGAGKSTMLTGIAGGFMPDSGRLLMDDEEITRWPEHKRARFIGRVFQDPLLGTCASMTIEQNMALAQKRGMARGLATGVVITSYSIHYTKLYDRSARAPRPGAEILSFQTDPTGARPARQAGRIRRPHRHPDRGHQPAGEGTGRGGEAAEGDRR